MMISAEEARGIAVNKDCTIIRFSYEDRINFLNDRITAEIKNNANRGLKRLFIRFADEDNNGIFEKEIKNQLSRLGFSVQTVINDKSKKEYSIYW